MLSQYTQGSFLEEFLSPQFRLFPDIHGRAFWDGLAEDYAAHFVPQADALLEQEQAVLPATLYMRFARDGDRSAFEARYFARRSALVTLAVAECLTNRGKYTDAAVNMLWCICEECTWCLPAHFVSILPDPDTRRLDLFAAETAATLAGALHLLLPVLGECAKPVSAMVKKCVRERVFTPFLTVDYTWMGLHQKNAHVNNWNPWINANVLFAALSLEDDPARLCAVVRRGMVTVDKFMESYGPDGGCDEGPTYWGVAAGKLFEYLEMLETALIGKLRLFSDPLVRNMGEFICKTHISGDWVVPVGDASPRGLPSGAILYDYGKRVGSQSMTDFGALLLKTYRPGGKCLHEAVRGMMAAREARGIPGAYPHVREAWYESICLMAARRAAGTDRGLCLAAKGGHNGVSHNHNDAGSFILYADGQPVLVDAGVETYTKQTFSPGRYELWAMQSAWHNLPLVNGVMQREGQSFAARDAAYAPDGEDVRFSLDIAGAYPEEAGIVSWRRDFTFARAANCVTLRESFQLARPSGDIRLHLLTPRKPVLTPGAILLGDVRIEYPEDLLACGAETRELTDGRMRACWGGRLYRIV
ncbi:MAG: heparinase II/III-family protein, partial [Firmicutes bacterium]|nr:heparinase II/III-family protein [Bacillota bacterium]